MASILGPPTKVRLSIPVMSHAVGHRTAKQVFENADLLRYIYGFGDASHRMKMKEVYEEGRNRSPLSKDEVPELQEGFKLFYKLVRCRCCSRHSHRKPWMKVYKNTLCSYEDISDVPEDKNFHDCDCACRHQARQLQRSLTLSWVRSGRKR